MKTNSLTENAQWNVLYTKPGFEKKVTDSLNNKNIKSYMPVKKSTAPWWNFRSTVEQPLFPSIVFVKISAKQKKEVKSINGVVNFLYWLGNPAVVKDHDITTIKVFLNTHSNVTVHKTPISLKFLNEGMSDENLEVDRIVYSDDFKIEIPTLGYSMIAEGVSSNIRYIKTERHFTKEVENVRLSNAS